MRFCWILWILFNYFLISFLCVSLVERENLKEKIKCLRKGTCKIWQHFWSVAMSIRGLSFEKRGNLFFLSFCLNICFVGNLSHCACVRSFVLLTSSYFYFFLLYIYIYRYVIMEFLLFKGDATWRVLMVY